MLLYTLKDLKSKICTAATIIDYMELSVEKHNVENTKRISDIAYPIYAIYNCEFRQKPVNVCILQISFDLT